MSEGLHDSVAQVHRIHSQTLAGCSAWPGLKSCFIAWTRNRRLKGSSSITSVEVRERRKRPSNPARPSHTRRTFVRILEGRARFLFSILVVLGFRLLTAAVVYYSAQNYFQFFSTPWVDRLNVPANYQPSWVLLFYGWDSEWYLGIAQNWYARTNSYNFFPAYPVLTRLVSIALFNNYLLAGFIASFPFGLVAAPLFQRFAENFMDRGNALAVTLLFSLFPFVSLFSSVAYAEPLFLTSSLAALELDMRGRSLSSWLMAAVATLTKSYGLLIVLPLVLNHYRRREFRKQLALAAIPIGALVGWMAYLKLATGDWLAFVAAHYAGWAPWENFDTVKYVQSVLTLNYSGLATGFITKAIMAFSLIFIVMSLAAQGLPRNLRAYCIVGCFAILLGQIQGFLRYFPFLIFPVWLTFRIRTPLLWPILLFFYFIVSVMIWFSFVLSGFTYQGWVG